MRLLGFLGIALLLALPACSSAEDPTPEMFAPATSSTLEPVPLSTEVLASCRVSAVSLCARLEGCATALLPLMYGTRASCEKAIADECALRHEGPGASPTPRACDAGDLSCDDMRTVLVRDLAVSESPGSVLLQFCPTTKGLFPVGASCLHGSDCTSGLCDNAPERCGRCIAAGGEGVVCNSNEGCEEGLHCLLRGASGRCVRFRREGEACSTESPCAGLSCNNGVCERLAQAGQRCDEEGPLCDEANALACGSDLTCQSFTVDKERSDACRIHILDTPDVGTRACPWTLEELKRRGACKGPSCRRTCSAS